MSRDFWACHMIFAKVHLSCNSLFLEDLVTGLAHVMGYLTDSIAWIGSVVVFSKSEPFTFSWLI
jgi:hypothetical protein